MKKVIFIIAVVLFVSVLTLVLKWSELKYYFYSDNTSIEVVSAKFDFGSLKKGDTLKHTFILKNIGDNDLTIKKVLPSCKCTVVEDYKKNVKSGDVSEIKVVFVADKIGKVEKNIILEANTAPPFHVLTLKGEVK